jgi:hypothetical protein
MEDSLYNNLLANAVLAGVYVIYKVADRCMHSRCRYGAEGLEFDIDPQEGEDIDPAAEMHKISELLKSRALVHSNTRRQV